MHIAKRLMPTHRILLGHLSDSGDLKKRPNLSPEKYFLAKNKLEQSYDCTRRLEKNTLIFPLKGPWPCIYTIIQECFVPNLVGSGEDF